MLVLRFLFQTDNLCLPPGLECYRNNVREDTGVCNIPCKGVFSDWRRKESKKGDLELNENFQTIFEEYKIYKSGFKTKEGTKYFVCFILIQNNICIYFCFHQVLVSNNALFLVFEKKTKIHLFRIHFGTFSYDIIKKDLKANLVDKLSHFGGTAGLFTGFSFITGFEIIVFVIMMLYNLYLFVRNKHKISNVVEVEEFHAEKNEEIFENKKEIFENKKEISENREKIEALKKKLQDIEKKLNEIEEKGNNQ